MLNLPLDSDKHYWHGYHEFYGRLLPAAVSGTVLEFGLFQGSSIRWLLQQYPAAKIIGADILPVQAQWPTSARVTYVQLDQDSESQVADVLRGEPLELIIEDGSHFPRHQSRCLRLGLPALVPGGTYVLEDIHTSHPAHAYFREEFDGRWQTTSLTLLLAIEHLRRVGQPMTKAIASKLSGDHFSEQDVLEIDAQIASVEVFRRSTLPLSCWRCRGTNFDYVALKCTCGTPLLEEADSMTAVVRRA